jgi:hypothetical protein
LYHDLFEHGSSLVADIAECKVPMTDFSSPFVGNANKLFFGSFSTLHYLNAVADVGIAVIFLVIGVVALSVRGYERRHNEEGAKSQQQIGIHSRSLNIAKTIFANYLQNTKVNFF